MIAQNDNIFYVLSNDGTFKIIKSINSEYQYDTVFERIGWIVVDTYYNYVSKSLLLFDVYKNSWYPILNNFLFKYGKIQPMKFDYNEDNKDENLKSFVGLFSKNKLNLYTVNAIGNLLWQDKSL